MDSAVRRPQEVGRKPLTVVRPNTVSQQKKKQRAKERTRVRRARRVRIFLAGVTTLACIGLLINIVIGYTVLSQMNREVSELSRDISALEAERDYTMMQLEPYLATERIQDLAKERLGMSDPTPSQIMRIAPSENANLVPLSVTERSESAGVVASVTDFFGGLFR